MHVLITCKYEEDSIKNEGARVAYCKPLEIFPDARVQLTPQSVVGSGRISNTVETLWLSSLPAGMKKIQLKIKALDWQQGVPHYNPMGAIRYHGNKSSDPIWPKT